MMKLEQANSINLLTINDFENPTSCDESLFLEEGITKDLWGFDFFWPSIVQKFNSVGELYGAIQDLYDKIEHIKEKYRPRTESFPGLEIEENQNRGVSGSYFMIDEEGKRRYVIKPLDEDAGCIHSDRFATPFLSSPFRTYISLYESSMREVLAYQIARSIGVEGIVPKTSFGIFESNQFHSFSDRISPQERDRYFQYCSEGNREKLCSVQEYVEGSKSLFEALQDLQQAGLSDEEIADRFDLQDFEEANLLLWTTYDTDGHMGNFLVYPKGVDEIGNEILGLKKIDNGLAFPEKNRELRNMLTHLPVANRPLSEGTIRKIDAIDIEKLAEQMEEVGLESGVAALRDRLVCLKTLALIPGITIKEINRKLIQLGKNQ